MTPDAQDEHGVAHITKHRRAQRRPPLETEQRTRSLWQPDPTVEWSREQDISAACRRSFGASPAKSQLPKGLPDHEEVRRSSGLDHWRAPIDVAHWNHWGS
jgi:hypothetical protein